MVDTRDTELRISDIDRERVAAFLHAAVGQGRITWEEHEERLVAVYAARTRGEIVPVLADLPVAVPPGESASAPVTGLAEPPLRVTLGKIRRRPDPSVGAVHVDVTLGAADIDLRELPRGAVVDVVANSLLGKVELRLSHGTRLIDTGTAYLGKRSTVSVRRWFAPAPGPLQPDAPVVRLRGHSVLGHVRVTIG